MNKKLNSLTLILSLLFTSASSAITWKDLWDSRDQQGAAALQQGKPVEAANLFNNEQWQGVANYRAGEYNKALSSFAKDQSTTGYYNSGNAHAFLKQYQEAIDAYTESLKLNPNNQDAKNNLEVVKKLMQQQKKNGQSSNAKDQARNEANSSQASNNAKAPKEKQPSKQNQSAKDESTQEKKSAQEPQNNSGQNKQTSANNTQQQNENSSAQWLRRVPDDPGGLLKQKFLRDHRRIEAERQQGISSW